MFQVMTGSFRALEEAFVSDLQDRRAGDPLAGLLVLSPSGRLLTRLQSLLAKKSPGFLNVQFLTFYALAERLLGESDRTEQVVTEPELYHEVIRHILAGDSPAVVDVEIRKALGLEGKPVSHGLAGALAATLKDLRDAGMRADQALEAAREGFLGTQAPESASTLALYARLVGLFEKQNLRSSADLLRRAAAEAPKHPWLRQQKAIFLYGFYDLTGVQLDLVVSLADHPDARVYFPYEEGNPAYAYAEKLLHDPAFSSKCKPKPSSPSVLVGDLSLTSTMGSPPTTAGNDEKKTGLEVWSCSGARDEVWLAAKSILRLVDEGVPFEEIALISRTLAPYLPALRDIFGAHQIPYVSSRGEPAGSHPLVKVIRSLLTMDERLPQAGEFKTGLEKSPYIQAPLFLPEPEKEALRPWSAHIRWATSRLRQAVQLPEDPTVEENVLYNAVLSTFDELKVLDALGRTVTRDHFLEIWQAKLDGLETPQAGAPHVGVQVLEVQQARGLSFEAVFLLGMNEKVFPRIIREDPFLSDAARSALAQTTGCRLGRKLDGYDEERFLFNLTRQAATRYFYLFTQRSDDEGRALIPSVYLKELERSEAGSPHNRRPGPPDLGRPGPKLQRLPRSIADKFINRQPLTWTPKELSFLTNRAGIDPKSLYAALGWNVTEFYRLLTGHRAVEAFKPHLGPYDGAIKDLALVQGPLGRPFSPSSLEDLAQCPFQYYAGHVLRIPVAEDLAPEGEMTPRALGQLFHKALELFYTACREKGLPREPLLSEQLSSALNACFQELGGRLSTVYPLALRSSKDIVFKELRLFLESDLEESRATGFVPRWFEQPLEGSIAEAIPYRFHGRPDRLDTREEGDITEVRVVDYKSGKPNAWSGRLETLIIQGKFLQLPIYLGLAGGFAEKTLGRKSFATEAALRSVRHRSDEGIEKTLSASFWESPSAPIFIDNIKELIGLVENGIFYIEPSTGAWGYCTRCDFARVCRKEHMPTRLRAERDPLRAKIKLKMGRTAPSKEVKESKKEKKTPPHVS